MVWESSKNKSQLGGKKRKERKIKHLSLLFNDLALLLIVPFSLCPSAFAHFFGYADHHAQYATK